MLEHQVRAEHEAPADLVVEAEVGRARAAHLREGRDPRRRLVVLERGDGQGGRIKLSGEIWSAKALNPGSVYEPGQQVDVVEIEGATALVV